jgi:hypothetical protein
MANKSEFGLQVSSIALPQSVPSAWGMPERQTLK